MEATMRTTIFVILLCGLAMSTQAQFKQRDFELALGGTLGTATTKLEYEGLSNEETQSYVYLALTPGYYIIDGLSIELDLGLRAMEEVKPGQLALLNLSYTYLLPSTHIGLFGRVGYGISNCVSVPGFLDLDLSRRSEDLDIGVLNAGVGGKFLMSESVFIRTEVNYRIHSYSEDYLGGTADYSQTTLSLLFGIGMLF
jgi:hypothetical protein